MGCRIIEGHEAGTDHKCAVLFCSTTGTAFGPLFEDVDEAQAFIAWLKADETRWANTFNALRKPSCDPRSYSADHLESLYARFRTERAEVT